MPTMEEIKKVGRKIGEKYGLRLMLLYGSRAKGAAKKDSDIDIAVLGNSSLRLGDITGIINDFMDALSVNEIDVKSLHKTNPLFRRQVVEGAILLYGEELDFAKFRGYAFRDYIESKSLFELKEKMVKKQLEKL